MHLNWQFIILILEPSFILTFLHHMSTPGLHLQTFPSPYKPHSLPLVVVGGPTTIVPSGDMTSIFTIMQMILNSILLYWQSSLEQIQKEKLISKLKSLTLSPRHQAKNRGGILDTNLIFDGRSRIWLTLPKCLCFSSRPILKNQCMLLSLVGWIIVMSFLAHRKKPQNNFNLCKI